MYDLLIETSRLLYQNKTEEGYKKVNEVIAHLINYLNGKPQEKVIQINATLVQALNAMESGDAVLLADVLRYEILPIL